MFEGFVEFDLGEDTDIKFSLFHLNWLILISYIFLAKILIYKTYCFFHLNLVDFDTV